MTWWDVKQSINQSIIIITTTTSHNLRDKTHNTAKDGRTSNAKTALTVLTVAQLCICRKLMGLTGQLLQDLPVCVVVVKELQRIVLVHE